MSRRYTEQKPDGTYEEYIVAGNGGKNKPDITVDSQLDAGSVNPVENRVVTRYASKVGDEDITGIAPTLSEAVIDINNNLGNKTKHPLDYFDAQIDSKTYAVGSGVRVQVPLNNKKETDVKNRVGVQVIQTPSGYYPMTFGTYLVGDGYIEIVNVGGSQVTTTLTVRIFYTE